ncbi:MAG: hypothetical protein ABI556_16455 [Gemmatimonadales bacterium]
MRFTESLLTFIIAAGASPFLIRGATPAPKPAHTVDTVYVKIAPPPLDYDELARHVIARMPRADGPEVIDGDLIVNGRLSVGGAPETGTDYALTVHAPNAAALRLISNETLKDPQRADSQHRHTGTLSLGQDGGLRLDQNSTCYSDARGCTADDRQRRHAYSGFDSLGDMSFYLSDVDSTGTDTAPRAQSLVFRLLDWDGNIHIHSHRPGQRIYFNSSTTMHAADLQWEVPLR